MSALRKASVMALTAVVAASLLTACGSGSDKAASGKAGQVKLSVVSLKPGSEKAAFTAFDNQVKIFEKANPGIKIESHEYEWTGPTFAAQLAGGTLPTVFTIPFTDGKSLIERHQLADLSKQVKTLSYGTKFNPNVLAAGQDANGDVYGIPTGAYGIGLQYNRALFTQAGLDPGSPPTTWEEIRADAKTIAQKTGKAGFAQMTKDNTGGWMLTTLTYALGGRMEDGTGTEVKATLTNDATKQALQTLHTMRWVDKSMGSNFLLDWGGINQEFAAGKIGMYMGGSDVYGSLKQQNNINPDDYGLAALPLSTSPDAGLLGGGTLAAVKANATEAEKAAAVKWIDYYYLGRLTNEKAAALDAKTLSDGKQPVGVPQLPLFDKATLDSYNGWIKSYINVPLGQMTSFTSGVYNQPLVPEPASHTQELYAALDSVVQAVLTKQNADVGALLAKANDDVQRILDKG
jgi:ABC-type glycerol-3-phosphate transport system substrate-binding protein